jgi:hypothetical protein
MLPFDCGQSSAKMFSRLGLSQHPDEHRPKRPAPPRSRFGRGSEASVPYPRNQRNRRYGRLPLSRRVVGFVEVPATLRPVNHPVKPLAAEQPHPLPPLQRRVDQFVPVIPLAEPGGLQEPSTSVPSPPARRTRPPAPPCPPPGRSAARRVERGHRGLGPHPVLGPSHPGRSRATGHPIRARVLRPMEGQDHPTGSRRDPAHVRRLT